MAEPARKPSTLDEESVLQRWVEMPDGRMELREFPLTPELFLDPQLEDKMVQGKRHSDDTRLLATLLDTYFAAHPDVMVLSDVKHFFGIPGLSAPAPDVSVFRGIRDKEQDRQSYSFEDEGVLPCLVIEVLSPLAPRIRHTDQVAKVQLYQRVGISEYLLVAPPWHGTHQRYEVTGYRLDGEGRYRPIDPDAEGRLLSETTGLWFAVPPEGDRVLLFDAATGERLLTPRESEAARQAAEDKATREADARRAAEEETARLREELARLKGSSS